MDCRLLVCLLGLIFSFFLASDDFSSGKKSLVGLPSSPFLRLSLLQLAQYEQYFVRYSRWLVRSYEHSILSPTSLKLTISILALQLGTGNPMQKKKDQEPKEVNFKLDEQNGYNEMIIIVDYIPLHSSKSTII